MYKVNWLPWKEVANIKDHHVSFGFAERVFADPDLYERYQGIRNGEPRWFGVGRAASGVTLAVAYTVIDHDDYEEIRLITARHADKTERRKYEKHRAKKYRT